MKKLFINLNIFQIKLGIAIYFQTICWTETIEGLLELSGYLYLCLNSWKSSKKKSRKFPSYYHYKSEIENIRLTVKKLKHHKYIFFQKATVEIKRFIKIF